MKCPFCSADGTTVVETRESEEGHIVRRRRRCGQCEKRFTTQKRCDCLLVIRYRWVSSNHFRKIFMMAWLMCTMLGILMDMSESAL